MTFITFTLLNFDLFPIKSLVKLTPSSDTNKKLFVGNQINDWTPLVQKYKITSNPVNYSFSVPSPKKDSLISSSSVTPSLSSTSLSSTSLSSTSLSSTSLSSTSLSTTTLSFKPKFTQICSSIIKKEKCLNGRNCKYAHDLTNLEITPCKYKICRFSNCSFLHINETNIKYCERLNIKF
jgi:hypothetical protein